MIDDNFNFEFESNFDASHEEERRFFLDIIKNMRDESDAVAANPVVWKSIADFKNYLISVQEIAPENIKMNYDPLFNTVGLNVEFNDADEFGVTYGNKKDFDSHFVKCDSFAILPHKNYTATAYFSYKDAFVFMKKSPNRK